MTTVGAGTRRAADPSQLPHGYVAEIVDKAAYDLKKLAQVCLEAVYVGYRAAASIPGCTCAKSTAAGFPLSALTSMADSLTQPYATSTSSRVAS